VRLTKKLANRLDGIDVSPHNVGDIVDLPPDEARLLLAEEWAIDRERRRRQVRDMAEDRRRKPTVRLRPSEDERPEQ
jgi:hypothetical protein